MRILRLLKRITSLCIFLTILFLVAGFVLVYSYSSFDQAGQGRVLDGLVLVSDGFYTDSGKGVDTVESAREFIELLPDNIQETFCRDWKVIICNEMPSSLQPYAASHLDNSEKSTDPSSVKTEVGGYSNRKLRVVFIKAYNDPLKSSHVFAHELGHVFDFEFGLPSSSDRFEHIYNLYKDSFTERDEFAPPGYGTSSQSEFFATVFKEYLLFPDHLLENAPEAYSFFEDIFLEASHNGDAANTLKYDLQSALYLVEQELSDNH